MTDFGTIWRVLIEHGMRVEGRMEVERLVEERVAQEREACAQEAEKYGYDHFCGRFTDPIATAIRARGQA